ncbi:hypothetical protein Taro_009214 [Colocasia esculenta]|uniref:Uncharacterized protein n=1 Tax=Colocasia esculenta TaxID=4460 RepID=A0A843TZI5_COLES|nr:hypothetical protein [Colocasia esculenta]
MLRTQSKNMKNWSSSVNTSSSSVDTRDMFQKTFWPTWDSVSTLDQGYKPCKVWFRFDLPLVDFKMTVCASRSRLNGEEERLGVRISYSPATKNFSTRPQQVLKLVPKRNVFLTSARLFGRAWDSRGRPIKSARDPSTSARAIGRTCS